MKNKDTHKKETPALPTSFGMERVGVRIKVCGMKHNTAAVAALQPDYLGFIFHEKSPRNYDLKEIPKLPPRVKKVGVFVNASLDFVLEKVNQFGFDVIQLHGNESPEYCKELRGLCQIERVTLSLSKWSRDPEKEHKTDSAKKPIPGPSGELRTGSVEVPVPSAIEVPARSPVEVPVPSAVEVPALSSVEVWKVFSIKDHFDFSVLEAYEPYVDAFLFDTKGKEKGGNGYTFDWEVLKDYPSKKPFVLSGGIGLDELDSVKNMLKTDLPLFAIDVNSKFEDQPGLKNRSDLEELLSFFRNPDSAK
ncbi:phosphoribosylanthranilate isomerase [Leeuwenhoekiella parthenopeia]|uniref:phosphoribosylanthranilate isomerase n=1 Tax=Leeuwenhoekiella parthenopeia TaxID=2890320 RepID=UPI0033130EF9